jgi:cytochrome P450 family 110
MNHMHSLPPGPRSKNIAMVHALRDACAYYARCAQRFGDPFTLPTPFGPLVMTGRPEGIRTIYGVNPEYLDIFVEELQPFLGSTSVMQTSGQEHLRRRQLLSPVFTRSSLAGYCATMSDVAAGFAASLKPGDHFVAQQAMHDLSLQIILRVFFGTQESQLEAARDALANVQRASAWWPVMVFFSQVRHRFWGLGPWARLTAALDTLDATIRKVIADRSAGSGTGGLIDHLLAAKFTDGSVMTESEIRDQLVSLVAAGHETVARGLAWVLYWVHRQPGVRERLLEELDRAGWPTGPDTVSTLRYLDAVCRETLRLSPIIPEVFRRLRRPLDLLGYHLPAGVGVATLATLVHMREELYPDPRSFRPERFFERAYSAFEFVPFGGGSHRCLGANFAMYEMKIVLATLLRHHVFRLIAADSMHAARQRMKACQLQRDFSAHRPREPRVTADRKR